MKKKRAIRLSDEERGVLNDLLDIKSQPTRVLRRAYMLLESEKGNTDRRVATIVGCSLGCVADMRRRFAEGGIARALFDAARSGAPRKFSDVQLESIVGMISGPPPEDCSRWTLDSICSEAAARGIVSKISIGRVHQLMKEHSQPPRQSSA